MNLTRLQPLAFASVLAAALLVGPGVRNAAAEYECDPCKPCFNCECPYIDLVFDDDCDDETSLEQQIQQAKNEIKGIQAEMRNLRRRVVLESRNVPARERREFVQQRLNGKGPVAKRMNMLEGMREDARRRLAKLEKELMERNRRDRRR